MHIILNTEIENYRYAVGKIVFLQVYKEEYIRRLTPNECRKLQGFPSDWKQVVSDSQAYKQFGNAVTVNVAYEVAKMVYEYMDKNLKMIEE